MDEPDEARLLDAAGDYVIIYAARRPSPTVTHLAAFCRAGWDRDDLVEYLLAVHPQRCAAVMNRLSPQDHALFQGIPELWRIVLDRLATDPTAYSARKAFHRHLAGCKVEHDREVHQAKTRRSQQGP